MNSPCLTRKHYKLLNNFKIINYVCQFYRHIQQDLSPKSFVYKNGKDKVNVQTSRSTESAG